MEKNFITNRLIAQEECIVIRHLRFDSLCFIINKASHQEIEIIGLITDIFSFVFDGTSATRRSFTCNGPQGRHDYAQCMERPSIFDRKAHQDTP